MNDQNENRDEVDLKEIITILQGRSKSIIYGVIIGTILLTGILMVIPKSYESNAVLSLGTISDTLIGANIPAFRSLYNVYSNANLFSDYLISDDDKSDWFIHDEIIEDMVVPVYGYDKKSSVSIDQNTVLGLKLTCAASTPEEASKRVVLLGKYIETVMLNVQIWDYFDVAKGVAMTDLAKNNSAILQSKFEINNLKDKSELLENKFLDEQGIKSTFEAQIVQVDEVTEKYLSPQQQLVSVKVSIKNNEIGVQVLERKNKKNQFMLDFFEKIEGFFDGQKSFIHDTELLDMINNKKESFFSQLRNNDAADEAYYLITERFNEFLTLRNAQYKFISGPTIPSEPVSPKVIILAPIGFVLLFFIFVFRALFLNWWKS